LRALGLDEKATTRTVKCPKCGGNVLAATGYCVKCKAKTVKAEEDVDEVSDKAVFQLVVKDEKGKVLKTYKRIEATPDAVGDAVQNARSNYKDAHTAYLTTATGKIIKRVAVREDVDEAYTGIAKQVYAKAKQAAQLRKSGKIPQAKKLEQEVDDLIAKAKKAGQGEDAEDAAQDGMEEGGLGDESVDEFVPFDLDEAAKDRTMRMDHTFRSEANYEKFEKLAKKQDSYGAQPHPSSGGDRVEMSMRVPVDADKYEVFARQMRQAGETPLKRETWLKALPAGAKKKLPDDVQKELGL
jgi:predicted Rdx family selenoprotein